MLNQNEDMQLIQAAQAGDKQAFNALVTKYQFKVFKIVARYISDPSEVMDVAQDTFIRVYKAIGSFRGDSSFYTWLYRIAVNTAKNHLIAQIRRVPYLDNEISEIDGQTLSSMLKEYGTPERMLICDEFENILNGVIQHLPSDLRTTIILREMEGLSYEEISEILSCPIGTVRSRIYRARETIEKHIQPYLKS